MTSIPQRPASADPAPIPDDDHEADLPLTMTASVVLTSLPRDAHAALAAAGNFEKEKGKCSTIAHPSSSLPAAFRNSRLTHPPQAGLVGNTAADMRSCSSNGAFQGRRQRADPETADLQDHGDAEVRGCGCLFKEGLEVWTQ